MGGIKKNQRSAFDPAEHNVTYPTKVNFYRSGFSSLFRLLPYTMNVDEEIDVNHHVSYPFLGVNYLFHSPYEMFSRTSKNLQSSPFNSLLVYINPQLTWIDEALSKYPPERRGCYLPDEKPLKYFRKFTKGNCQSECLINATLETCGCVQFYMIRNDRTRVCGVNDMKCYKHVEETLQQDNKCACYLDCGEIEYNFDVRRMEFTKYNR
jgi:Amiloride-sensitive sodium channel